MIGSLALGDEKRGWWHLIQGKGISMGCLGHDRRALHLDDTPRSHRATKRNIAGQIAKPCAGLSYRLTSSPFSPYLSYLTFADATDYSGVLPSTV